MYMYDVALLCSSLSFRYGLAWVLAGICQRGAEITMPFVLSLWAAYNVQACSDMAMAKGENVTFGSINVNDCTLPIAEGTPNKTYLNWYAFVGGLTVVFVTIRGLVSASYSSWHPFLLSTVLA